jgi:hypothetical protein
MKVAVYKDKFHHDKLGISEIIKENPKSYSVKDIESFDWDNTTCARFIHKDEILYRGELTPDIMEIISRWNITSKRKDNEQEELDNKYLLLFNKLIEKLILENKELK